MCEVKGPNFYRCDCPSSKPEYRAAKARARYAADDAAGATAVIDRDAVATADPADGRSVEELREIATLIDRHYSHADPAATAALTADFGSPLAAIRVLGTQITGRAEKIAGVTGTEANAEQAERYDAAFAEVLRLNNVGVKAADEAYRRFDQTMTAEGVQRWTATTGPGSFKAQYRAYEAEFVADIQAQIKAATAVLDAIRHDDLGNLTKLASGYREALAEIRPTGGSLATHEASDVKAVELAGTAAQIYPSAWLEATRSSPLGVVMSKERAHFSETGVTSDSVVAKPDRVFYPGTPDLHPNRVYTLVTAGVGPNGADPEFGLYSRQMMDVSATKKKPAGDGWEPIESDGSYLSGGKLKRVKAGNAWRRPARGKIPGHGIKINADRQGVTDQAPGFAVAAHELGHFFQETVPGITAMEKDWLVDRTTVDGVRERLQPIRPRSDELVRRDNFVTSYIGRKYVDRLGREQIATEVLTVGVQAMFGGDYGGLVGAGQGSGERRGDDDMRAVILGIMASAAMSKPTR